MSLILSLHFLSHSPLSSLPALKCVVHTSVSCVCTRRYERAHIAISTNIGASVELRKDLGASDRLRVMQVLAHPWMTACSPLPRVNEIEEEVSEYVAGKLKPDESRLLGQVLKPFIRC